jgi:hypothetical protein
MLLAVLLTALSLPGGPAVDKASVYAAVLQAVQVEHPGQPIVLSETWSDVECAPLCADTLGREQHSVELIQRLQARGLVDATCRVPKNAIGCPSHPKHVFVALGDIQDDTPEGGQRVEGGVWVLVVTHTPCREPLGAERCQSVDASGFRFLVKQNENGVWKVVKARPEWIA